MVLRKVVAFFGLLGVIYALALQHGVFDRADAAQVVPRSEAPAPATAQAQPKAESKAAAKKAHSRH
jgi:hypothetical protein